MTIPAYSLTEIKKFKPCHERFSAVSRLKLRGKVTARQAVEAGVTFDDLLWAASAIAQTDKDVERRVRLWLADVAAHVLQNFEKHYPTDNRPRNAIIAARQLARGEIDVAAAWSAAASAAWSAAASAESAAWSARSAARSAEEQWQLDRLVYWLSEENPQDLPLPEKQRAAA